MMLTALKYLNIVKCSKLCYGIGGLCHNCCLYTINDKNKVKFNCQSTAYYCADEQSLKVQPLVMHVLFLKLTLLLLLNEVWHVSIFPKQSIHWLKCNQKMIKWQCADLNIQHSWHFKSFNGMLYCNSMWDKETAKILRLFEITEPANSKTFQPN